MDPIEQFKAMQKAGWACFSPLQTVTIIPAARLVKHARIAPNARVLDVACGTGVVSVTAARNGAHVTGVDISPDLLAAAVDNARIAGVDFHEGDVERLPFDASAFDAVVSQFGHIFAPRPIVAVAEMLRVLKPGGTIAFSTWPPELFVGRIFALAGRFAPPPPPGVEPPQLWGDPTIVRERLGTAVRDIVFDRGAIPVPALSPAHSRETVERTAGPIVKLVERLKAADPAKLAAFRREYEAIASEYSEDNMMHQGYLLTRATKN